jgi:hypothetical protein
LWKQLRRIHLSITKNFGSVQNADKFTGKEHIGLKSKSHLKRQERYFRNKKKRVEGLLLF